MAERPPHAASSFRQQRLPACQPFLTPFSAAVLYTVLFFVLGGISVPYSTLNKALLELEFDYTTNCSSSCVMNFSVSSHIPGPFFIFYSLSNVFQNSFLYSASKSWKQLEGFPFSNPGDLHSCAPDATRVNSSDGHILVPCGAVPLSLFNDVFTFSDNFPVITSNGISLQPFRKQFEQPSKIFDNNDLWLNLSEFPGGQTNERFVNWVQTAPFGTFRKLWAKTSPNASLDPFQNYSVEITNRFPVASFGGKKKLLVTHVAPLGAKNHYFAPLLWGAAGLSAIAAATFGVVHCLARGKRRRSTTSMSIPLLLSSSSETFSAAVAQ